MKPVPLIALNLSDLSGGKYWLAAFNEPSKFGFKILVNNLMTDTEAASETFCVLTKNETMEEVVCHSVTYSRQKPSDF